MTGVRLKHYRWRREGKGMSAEEPAPLSANGPLTVDLVSLARNG